jgi:hypothetical protein
MRGKLPVVFSSGAFGGFVESLLYYIFSLAGIAALFGMPAAKVWKPEMVYRPVVWGGLWGITFLIPFLDELYVLKGIALSLLPTLAAWFIFIPERAPANMRPGLRGLALIVILNALWGIATVLTIKYFEKTELNKI